ncbi:MAG: hypothetical protein IPK69_02065 [Phycisphaerales bacterium]|nr:MAG: hypothetical protein IPK69_02065 [Phycisphaerales bacterium]
MTMNRVSRSLVASLLGVMGVCGAFMGEASAQQASKPGEMAIRSQPAFHVSEENRIRAQAALTRAHEFLASQQDKATGGWCIDEKRPNFPAITALALQGYLLDPATPMESALVQDAVKFILNSQQADGGFYDKILPNYNTAICISALSKVNTPQSKEAVKKAVAFLKSLQYGEGAIIQADLGEGAEKVDKDHAFYGGWGYGKHGRPDMSNTAFAVQALHDAGVDASDASIQRALVFLQRCQMAEKADSATGVITINDMPYAKGSRQGGFVYATSVNKDQVGSGQSQAAATIEETLDDGTVVSRLRAYGSMTYAGFKSYLYANLRANDPRVRLAHEWMMRNYTLEENPGAGTDGLYYYYLMLSRALSAGNIATIDVKGEGGVKKHEWADELVAKLLTLQNSDGSFRSVDDRWMEDNPVLITSYSVLALEHALGR